MKAIFLMFASVSIFSFGAPLDKSIVEGNTTVYSNLFEKISKESNLTEDMLLQKSLLKELNNTRVLATYKSTWVPKAQNVNSYKTLFLNYLDKIRHIATLKKQLADTDGKIKTIEDEIDSMDSKSLAVLTNELQDAMYHKTKKLLENKLKFTDKEIKQIQHALSDSLKHIPLDSNATSKDILMDTRDILEYKHKITRTNIALEQEELINNKDQINYLNDELARLQAIHKTLAINLLADHFLLFASKLQNKDQTVFDLQKKLISDVKRYKIIDDGTKDDYFSPFLVEMENRYLGKLNTVAGAGKQEIQDVVNSTWKMLNNALFYINKTPISIIKIIVALLIFAVGFVIALIYRKYIKRLSFKSRTLTESTSTLLANMGHYLIFLITFFAVLKFLGIDLSSIALVAGALSVGIGFGLQNIISNFVSGIILMVERSIKIGDYIEIDESLRGYVQDIKMRSVTIVTNENINVIIPNQKLIENNVINWTMNDNIRRFAIPFGVAYGTDAHKVIDLIRETVVQSEYRDDIVETKKYQTNVIMTGMGDSSINFELFVWVKGDNLRKPKRTASAFMVLIYETLNKNNIEIPFPQQDIHIKSIQEAIPFKVEDPADNRITP